MIVDNPLSTNWRDCDWNSICMDRLCFCIKVKSMKAKAIQSLSIREIIGIPVTNESNKRDLSF